MKKDGQVLYLGSGLALNVSPGGAYISVNAKGMIWNVDVTLKKAGAPDLFTTPLYKQVIVTPEARAKVLTLLPPGAVSGMSRELRAFLGLPQPAVAVGGDEKKPEKKSDDAEKPEDDLHPTTEKEIEESGLSPADKVELLKYLKAQRKKINEADRSGAGGRKPPNPPSTEVASKAAEPGKGDADGKVKLRIESLIRLLANALAEGDVSDPREIEVLVRMVILKCHELEPDPKVIARSFARHAKIHDDNANVLEKAIELLSEQIDAEKDDSKLEDQFKGLSNLAAKREREGVAATVLAKVAADTAAGSGPNSRN
jgi:hypothetical protein